MRIPLQITFRDMPSSAAVERFVEEQAAKLEQSNPRIMGCRVAVELPHRHRHKNRMFRIRIDLTVPGGEVVVTRDPSDNDAHEDCYTAIRDAFRTAERQLHQQSDRRRGYIKTHLQDVRQIPNLKPRQVGTRVA